MLIRTRLALAALALTSFAACPKGPGSGNTGADNAKVASLKIAPDQAYLAVGGQYTFVLEATDAAGKTLHDVTAEWSVNDATVVSIQDGAITGLKEGGVLVTARVGRVQTTAVAAVLDVDANAGSSESLIDADLKAGNISDEQALVYKVLATFKDPHLPPQYLSAEEGGVDNDSLAEVALRWDTLSDDSRSLVGNYLLRPADPGNPLDGSPSSLARNRSTPPSAPQLHAPRSHRVDRPTCRPYSDHWLSVTGTHVVVWYRFSVPGQADKARALAAAVDNDIHPKLVDGLGMNAPVSDASHPGCNGLDGKYDVYLVPNLHDEGLTVPEDNGYGGSVFTMLRAELPTAHLEGTLAHEYFHAIQWAYTMKAYQISYGWIRDATANWAIDYVYGTTHQNEQDFAPCYLNTIDTNITDRSLVPCKGGHYARDYGAYLFFQYLSKKHDPALIKSIISSLTAYTNAAEAIDSVVPGGFQKEWPEFAKVGWNYDPVIQKPDSFKGWDALKAGPPDTGFKGDLQGAPEAKETLIDEIENLAIQYYHFSFGDPATRSVLFYNGFYDAKAAGKHLKTFAYWKDGAGNWQEEDWSDYEFVGICRDVKAQRASELVVIISNAETSSGDSVKATQAPYLARSNVGCYRYSGSIAYTDLESFWTGTGVKLAGNLEFTLTSGGDALSYKNPAYPNTLRVGTFLVSFPTSGSGTYSASYTTGNGNCTVTLGTSAFSVGAFGGSLWTHAFDDLKSNDASIQAWESGGHRIYTASAASMDSATATESGMNCGSTQTNVAADVVLMTNDNGSAPQNGAPSAAADGHFKGSYTLSGTTWTWDLSPQAQP